MKRQLKCRVPCSRTPLEPVFWLAAGLACFSGCSALFGLDDYQIAARTSAAQSGSGCSTHQACKSAGARRDGEALDFCVSDTRQCVALKSLDCATLTGPVYDDRAILLGSLFATSGAQSVVNLAREQSAQLAVEEINSAGGLPASSASETPRPLALISCDASKQPLRAAEHLVNTLKLPAIIGPNNSQTNVDIARKLSIPGGTLTLSPTAVAASIAELRDEDLAWQMVPHDAQRGPLLVYEIGEIERALKAERGRPLKLGVIVRDDALGEGTRASLTELTWNGKSLAEAVTQGSDAKIDTYVASDSEQTQLVAKYLEFAPDVMVLVGAADAISGIMAPLERGRRAGFKPQYLLVDSSKVPELLALVEELPDLAARVRGTGITPSPESVAVNQGFLLDYHSRYPEEDQATSSGVGPSYDATYAIALALAAARGKTSGRDIARGLRRLNSGDEIPLGPSHVLAAFRRLASGEPVSAIGTFSRLAWDDRGALSAGTIEIWCVETLEERAVFTSSGLTAEIPSQAWQGENKHCAVRPSSQGMVATAAPPPNSGQMPSTAGAPAAAGAASVPPTAAMDAGVSTADAGVHAAAGAGGATTLDTGPRPGMAGRPAPPSAPARPIPCGTLQCQRSRGEYCCISTLRPGVAFESDFSCETTDRPCGATLRCTSDRECDNSAICCMNEQRESYCRAAGSCGSSERHLACDSPLDCGSEQVCCSHGSDPAALMATSCADSCEDVSPGSLQLCTRQSQCNTLNGCRNKPGLPTVALCL